MIRILACFSIKSKKTITPLVFRKDYKKLSKQNIIPLDYTKKHTFLDKIKVQQLSKLQLLKCIQDRKLMRQQQRYLKCITLLSKQIIDESQKQKIRLRIKQFIDRYGYRLGFDDVCQLASVINILDLQIKQQFLLYLYKHVRKAHYFNQQLDKQKLYKTIKILFCKIKQINLQDQLLTQQNPQWTIYQFAQPVVKSLPTLIKQMYQSQKPFSQQQLIQLRQFSILFK